MQTYITKWVWRYFNKSTRSCIELERKSLPYWDLTMVYSGELNYTIDGVRYSVKKNDIILIPKGCHRTREGGTAARFVSFNFSVLPDVELPRDILYKNTVNDEIKGIVALFPPKNVSDFDRENPIDINNSRAKATNMLNYILLEIMNYIEYQNHSVHVKNAMKYINDNILSNISLEDVSKHLHLTKEYTATLFKRETQKTVSEYVNERKMLYAKEAIQNGNITLAELASRLGYENYGYFSKVFKKHFGVSPANYRSISTAKKQR